MRALALQILTVAIVATLIARQTAIAGSEPIRIANTVYPPYSIQCNDGHTTGHAIEIVRAGFKSGGRNVHVENYPWARAIQLVETGEVDVLTFPSVGMSVALQLSEQPVAALRGAIFARAADGWRYNGVASLKGKSVITVDGYDYRPASAAYQNFLDTSKTVTTINSSEGFQRRIIRMLMAERVDVFAEAEDVMMYYIRSVGAAGKIIPVGSLGDPIHLHVGFKPGPHGRSLKENFDVGYQRIAENGTVAAILRRFDTGSPMPCAN